MVNNIIILSSIFFILAAGFFGIYLATVKDASKSKWKLLLYLIVTGILIGILSVLGFLEFTELPIEIFFAANAWLLVVGIVHSWLFEKIIKINSKVAGKILFTIAVCLFGFGLMLLAYKGYFKTPFPRFYFLPALFFLAPTFVFIAFSKFIEIPLKVFKTWIFPAPGTLPDPSDNEMADPIIVNFEISKQFADKRTVFKAKAPKGMNLGKLFYFFIMDYNSRHSDNPIMIADSNNKPFGWSFYVTQSIIQGRTHLDPEVSVSGNRIKENASVICERTNQ